MAALGPALPGSTIVDLFAGSGALGLEALSRGASSVTFVERSRAALRTLRANVAILGAESESNVVVSDAIAYAARLEPMSFDIGLADPPYGLGLAARLLERFAATPFASQIWVEHRISDPIQNLGDLQQRHYGDTVISILKGRP